MYKSIIILLAFCAIVASIRPDTPSVKELTKLTSETCEDICQ